MIIRRATKKDLNKIAELHFEYGQYEHHLDKNVEAPSLKREKEQDKKYMGLGTIYFIAEEGQKAVGVLSINLCLQGKEKTGVLHTLIVTKDARKKGYGNQLVNHAMNFFRKNGCSRVRTFVHFKNKNAYAFWKKQGFDFDLGHYAVKRLK